MKHSKNIDILPDAIKRGEFRKVLKRDKHHGSRVGLSVTLCLRVIDLDETNPVNESVDCIPFIQPELGTGKFLL